jgi:hypothetical protein
MIDNVPEPFIGAFEGNDHPILEEFGESPNGFLNELKCDISLLKIIVGVVENEGHAPGEVMVQVFLELVIGILRNLSRELRQFLLSLIVVDGEMGCLNVFPFKTLVLDFILAKFLRREQCTEQE